MKQPILYRKRLIPEECIPLKNDKILYFDENIIVTSWQALKPKKDLHHGFSCYFLKEGYKVSKFYQKNNQLLYWYCDIINHTFEADTNTFIFTDLLADVIIYPDGFVKVVDLDELVTALEQDKFTLNDLKTSLNHLNKLLNIIYSGDFDKLKAEIETRES